MKPLFFILFFSLLISAFSFSQKHYLTQKGGITISNIDGSSLFSELDNYVRVSAGLGYTFKTKSPFFFGADLLYNQYGGKLKQDYFYQNGGFIPLEDETIRYEYNYYSLPLKVGLTHGDKAFFFLSTGVIPSYQIRSLIKFPDYTSGMATIKETYDVTDNVNRFDLAGLFEIGGGFRISQRFSIVAEANVRYSMTTFTNKNHFQDTKGRHYGITSYLGVRYMLTNPNKE